VSEEIQNVLGGADAIQNVMQETFGLDFVGSPRRGRNRIVTRFEPLIKNGGSIQDILSTEE
jgi:hypothetical protein